MGTQERDYMRDEHPPFCTCVGCERRKQKRRLSDADKEKLDTAFKKAGKTSRYRKVVHVILIILLIGALLSAVKNKNDDWIGEAIGEFHGLLERLLTHIENR